MVWRKDVFFGQGVIRDSLTTVAICFFAIASFSRVISAADDWTRTWQELAQADALWGASLIEYDQTAYLYGGLTNGSGFPISSGLYSLDLSDPAATWTVVSTTGDRPPALFGHTATYYVDPNTSNPSMMLYGGAMNDFDSGASNGMYVLDLTDLSWRQPTQSSYGPATMYHATVYKDEVFYFFGGGTITTDNTTLIPPGVMYSTGWDSTRGLWQWNQFVTNADYPDPRFGAAFLSTGDALLLYGGATRSATTPVLETSPTWMWFFENASWVEIPEAPDAKSGCLFSGAVTTDESSGPCKTYKNCKLIVNGGLGATTGNWALDTLVSELDLFENVWSTPPITPGLSFGFGTATTRTSDNQLLAVGGSLKAPMSFLFVTPAPGDIITSTGMLALGKPIAPNITSTVCADAVVDSPVECYIVGRAADNSIAGSELYQGFFNVTVELPTASDGVRSEKIPVTYIASSRTFNFSFNAQGVSGQAQVYTRYKGSECKNFPLNVPISPAPIVPSRCQGACDPSTILATSRSTCTIVCLDKFGNPTGAESDALKFAVTQVCSNFSHSVAYDGSLGKYSFIFEPSSVGTKLLTITYNTQPIGNGTGIKVLVTSPDSCPQFEQPQVNTSTGATCVCNPGYYRQNTTGGCVPCMVGYSKLDPGDQACVCAAGFYNRQLVRGLIQCKDTSGDTTFPVPPSPPVNVENVCVQCPSCADCAPPSAGNATDQFNGRAMPSAGFWQGDEAAPILYVCPLGAESCPGGAAHKCSAAYTGPLCTMCADGYTKSGVDSPCEPCGSNSIQWLAIAAIAVGYLIFIIVLVRSTSESGSTRSILLKILLNYTQTLVLVGQFRLRASKILNGLMSVLGAVSGQSFVIRYSCVVRVDVLDSMLADVVVITAAVLPVVILQFWSMRQKQLRASHGGPGSSDADVASMASVEDDSVKLLDESGNSKSYSTLSPASTNDSTPSELPSGSLDQCGSWARWVRPTSMVLIFVVYPFLSQRVFEVVGVCLDVDGQSLLAADLSLSCDNARVHRFRAWGFVVLALYVFGIPIAVAMLLRQNREAFTHPHVADAEAAGSSKSDASDITTAARGSWAHALVFLRGSYRNEYYLWEFVIMARKLAVAALAAGISDAANQTIAGIGVINLALMLQLYVKPLRTDLLNAMESASLAITNTTLVLSAFYLRSSAGMSAAITVMLLILNVGFVMWMVVLILREGVSQLRKMYERRSNSKASA